MPTIDATKSGIGANSYVTVAAADTFFDELYLATEWSEQSENDKIRILITASRKLDTLPLTCSRYSEDQALMFPLNVGTDDVPEEGGWSEVQEATFHQALHHLRYGETLMEPQEQAIQALNSRSPGKMSMVKSVAGFNEWNSYSPESLRMLADWLSFGMSVARG